MAHGAILAFFLSASLVKAQLFKGLAQAHAQGVQNGIQGMQALGAAHAEGSQMMQDAHAQGVQNGVQIGQAFGAAHAQGVQNGVQIGQALGAAHAQGVQNGIQGMQALGAAHAQGVQTLGAAHAQGVQNGIQGMQALGAAHAQGVQIGVNALQQICWTCPVKAASDKLRSLVVEIGEPENGFGVLLAAVWMIAAFVAGFYFCSLSATYARHNAPFDYNSMRAFAVAFILEGSAMLLLMLDYWRPFPLLELLAMTCSIMAGGAWLVVAISFCRIGHDYNRGVIWWWGMGIAAVVACIFVMLMLQANLDAARFLYLVWVEPVFLAVVATSMLVAMNSRGPEGGASKLFFSGILVLWMAHCLMLTQSFEPTLQNPGVYGLTQILSIIGLAIMALSLPRMVESGLVDGRKYFPWQAQGSSFQGPRVGGSFVGGYGGHAGFVGGYGAKGAAQFEDNCGAGCGPSHETSGVLNYVGAGGDYMAQTSYDYVGRGAGDLEVVPMPTNFRPNICMCIVPVGLLLLFVPLSLYCVMHISSTGWTTTMQPVVYGR